MRRTAFDGTVVWIAALLVALLAAGCGGGGDGQATGTSGAQTGRVAILLTDAPSDDFDAINVTVKRVYLLGDEEQTLLAEFPGDGRLYNLLNLRDSAELMMDPAVVEAGCYDKIRLVVGQVELVRGDETFEAKLPGNGKIDLNPRGEFRVVPGETLVVQLDMDASKQGPRK